MERPVQDVITTEYIKEMVKLQVEKNRNREIYQTLMKEGAEKCMENGLVSVIQYSKLKDSQERLKSEEEAGEYSKRDMPHGTLLELWFKDKPVTFRVVGSQRREGIEEEKEFELVPGPGQSINLVSKGNITENKSNKSKKHLFIYSYGPHFGKTTVVNGLIETCNAVHIGDVNNFQGVRQNAQFMIFDDYRKECSLQFDELMQLAGGKASDFKGKRINNQSSYIPREDSQIIIFSNQHPYEIYAETWNKQRQQHFISQARAHLLNSHFHIVKLDEEETGATAEMDASKFSLDAENAENNPRPAKKAKLRGRKY